MMDPALDAVTDPFELCSMFCETLGLQSQVRDMAQPLTGPLSAILLGYHRSSRCIAALSIYIALHLLNFQGPVIADHMARLAPISESEENIRGTWRLVHPERDELVEPSLLPELAANHMDAIIGLLPHAVPENDLPLSAIEPHVTDSDVIHDEERSEILRQLSGVVQEEGFLEAVGFVSEGLAGSMTLMFDNEGLDFLSERACEAVSTYMASHFIGVEISAGYTARLYKMSERTFGQMYARVLDRSIDFTPRSITSSMGEWDPALVLEVLPELNWPAFD